MLLPGQLRIQHQFGHSDHAIHGSADLVTHIGEKLAFGAAGRLGLVPGLDQLDIGSQQLGSACLNFVLQAVAMSQQFAVAALDFGEHLIERIGELPELVVGPARRPRRIVLFPRDTRDGLRQVGDRPGNGALQHRRQSQRQQRGNHQDQQHDAGNSFETHVQFI